MTTHDWSHEVDTDHLLRARELSESLGDALPVHLVLEVVAYADDEASATGRRGHVTVTVDGPDVEVVDDGRGTDTRRDEAGRPVRKPVMATRDVRFFDVEDPPVLPDGLPRRGMSTVAAASPALVHENRRREGAWRQSYRHGCPDSELREVPWSGHSGTSVTLRLPTSVSLDVERLEVLVREFTEVNVVVEEALSGGNASAGVVRVGDTMRKPWLPTTPRTADFTHELRRRGIEVPELRGRDDRGRQVLDFVPGDLAMDRTPLDTTTVRRVGTLIRRIHDASEGLEVPADWEVLIPADGPDLVCHNDLAPWNLVIDGDRLVFIDWDGAGPSTRLWDLAYAALAFGHLFPGADVEDSAARLSAFVDGYAADEELRVSLPESMGDRAAAMHELLRSSHARGREPWGSMYIDGHGEHWARTTRLIREHEQRWALALRRGAR